MARVALVTGGTRGIGAAISLALKAQGRTVVATYAGNDAAAEAFKAEHGIATYKFDVSSFDACTEALALIVADVGPVEILVNNAGITRDATMLRMRRDLWHRPSPTLPSTAMPASPRASPRPLPRRSSVSRASPRSRAAWTRRGGWHRLSPTSPLAMPASPRAWPRQPPLCL